MIISSLTLMASDLGGIQTRDLQNRNLTLYSAKLRDQAFCKITNKIPNSQKNKTDLCCSSLYERS